MKAVLNVGHTGCVGSITIMLRSLGYEVSHLNDTALMELMLDGAKGDVRRGLLRHMGYDRVDIPYVSRSALNDCDLYVGIKEKNLDQMQKLYPGMKMLLFTINGGRVPYETSKYPVVSANFYTNGFKCYVPFMNQWGLAPRETSYYDAPIDLLHNAEGWGFNFLIEPMIKMGLKIYGYKGSPAGLIYQKDLKEIFNTALCMVHLKASDSPGYALYEAFASGVPIILPALFVDRMKYHELYQDGETCLTFGKYVYTPTDDPDAPDEDWDKHASEVIREIYGLVERLKDPKENKRIGMNGFRRWKELTVWTEDKAKELEVYFKKHGLL